MNRDAYQSRLRELLLRKLPESRTDELVREFASHLSMSTQAKSAAGLAETEAERQAVAELGSVEVLVEDLIRRESGIDTKSVWKIASWSIVSFAVYGLGSWVYALRIQPYDPLPTELMGYAVLLIFGTAVWRSRRWLLLPMAVAAVICPIMVTFMLLMQPMRVWAGESRQATLDGFDRQIARQRDDLRKGEAALRGNLAAVREGTQYRIPTETETISSLRLPFLPFSIPLPSTPQYTWLTSDSKTRAETAWKKDGSGYVAHLREELAQATETRDRIASGNDRATLADVSKHSLGFIAVGAVSVIAVFAVINGSILWLASRRRRKRMEAPMTTT
jgi:hypothetical protein